MKKIYPLLIMLLVAVPFLAFSQNAARPVYAFQPNEKISYTVYYNVLGMYVNAGSATFTTSSEKLQDANVFHVVGEGSTNPKYDWIFKVRDRYESYFNSTDLQPVKFIRQINEGKFQKTEEVTFNPQANTATTKTGVYKVPENVQDVISVLYFARNINYDQYHNGDKIPFNMFLDDQVYNMYIHYIGKEVIQTRYGKFNAIKLKPLLLKGSIFEGGEDMTIWVTDDANHIPVRIESPIVVGSVKVDLMHFENLKYPITMVQ
jgi:hypothetical protein